MDRDEKKRGKPNTKVSKKLDMLSNTALEWMTIHLAAVQLEQICSYVEDLRENSARKIQHWFAKHMKPSDPINRWVFKDCEVAGDHWSMSWRRDENYFDIRRNRDEWYRHQQSKPHYRRFYYNYEACEVCAYEVGFLSNEDNSELCWRNVDWKSINRGDGESNMTLCWNCYRKHEFGPCHECHYEWLDDTQDCHKDIIRVNWRRLIDIEDPSVDAMNAIFCDRTCYDTFKSKQQL